MSAIGLPGQGRNFVISATGYHHSHRVFERQQSLEMRGMEWEDRVKPLTSWSVLAMRGFGAVALLTAMAVIAA